MKRRLVAVAVVAVIGFGAYLANVEIQAGLGERALHETGLGFARFEDALVLAKTQHKPVLVDFSATWCPNCRALHEQVFSNARVKQRLQADYVLALVDYDSAEATPFRSKYGAQALPSVLLIDSDGQLLRQIQPSLDPDEFLRRLNG